MKDVIVEKRCFFCMEMGKIEVFFFPLSSFAPSGLDGEGGRRYVQGFHPCL